MSNISIIGTGNMARAIGALAVAGGNTVEVIGRDQSKAADLAKALGGAATGEFGAVPAGDIVIMALRYADVVPVVTKYGDALADKVIIDISNPFNADADGLAIPDDTSIAQDVAKAAPASASVVKAFNTVFGHVLKEGRTLDVFFAGDDAQAKACRVGVHREPRAAPAGCRWLEHGALAGRNESGPHGPRPRGAGQLRGGSRRHRICRLSRTPQSRDHPKISLCLRTQRS